jgi:hypothetical protein
MICLWILTLFTVSSGRPMINKAGIENISPILDDKVGMLAGKDQILKKPSFLIHVPDRLC